MTTRRLEFVRRFQQLSTAVAAKAIEDTAVYRYVRYIAAQRGGRRPARFSADIGTFHQTVARWQREQPRGMRGTSTHDSKRGEDVRARLTVLAERCRRVDRDVSSAGDGPTRCASTVSPMRISNTTCIKPWWARGR